MNRYVGLGSLVFVLGFVGSWGCAAESGEGDGVLSAAALLTIEEQRCVDEATLACIEPGGACEVSARALGVCAAANDCIDPSTGALDGGCAAELCPGSSSALATCLDETCGAVDACVSEPPAGEGSDEGAERTPEEPICETEQLACYGAGGPCEAPIVTLLDCAERAGCVEGGLVYGACVREACAEENGRLGACVAESCSALSECAGIDAGGDRDEDRPIESFECVEETEACLIEGPCAEVGSALERCADAGDCISAGGALDPVCLEEAGCGAELDAYGLCITSEAACEPLLECAPEAVPPAPEEPSFDEAACRDAQTACFADGGPCGAEGAAYSECVERERCLEEADAEACIEARCGASYDALISCALPNCPDVAERCAG